MSWLRVDDAFLDHPKFLRLDLRALRVWFRALVYATRVKTTGGFVSDAALEKMGATERIRAALTTPPPGFHFGLWEDREGGIAIHDYADYQPTGLTQSRAQAGRKGGLESARRRSSSGRRSDDVPTTFPARTEHVLSTYRARSDDVPGHFNGGNQSESLVSRQASACNPVPSRPVPSQPVVERAPPRGHAEPPEPVALEPLSPRMRELGEGVRMAAGGPSAFDLEAQWLTFATSGKPLTELEWRRWCGKAAAFARQDRDRERRRVEERDRIRTAEQDARAPAPVPVFRPPPERGDERPMGLGEFAAALASLASVGDTRASTERASSTVLVARRVDASQADYDSRRQRQLAALAKSGLLDESESDVAAGGTS